MLYGVRVRLAPYKGVTVSYVTTLDVETVHKRLTIKPMIEGSVIALKSSRPISEQGPVQPWWKVASDLSADWLRMFIYCLE